MRLRSASVRLARIVALAIVIGIGINHIWWSVADWHLGDMDAYWEAAMRLRAGEPLFPPVADVLHTSVYRYSPWFAWMWVPLTSMPREAVNVGWSLLLIGASFAAVWPLMRRGAWVAVAFFLPLLIAISSSGNVHALMIAALVLGVDHRTGPAWIGIAASLKAFPILFALTYVGRRQWLRALTTGVIAVLLVSPYLAYDLTHYVTTAGAAASISRWLPAYVIVVVLASGAALWLARTRWRWLASSVAVTVALPRLFLYDITYLAVGVRGSGGTLDGSGQFVHLRQRIQQLLGKERVNARSPRSSEHRPLTEV